MTVLLLAVAVAVDVWRGGEVDEQSGEDADEGDEAGEGEVLPRVAGGDLAVGEGVEGVGEEAFLLYLQETCEPWLNVIIVIFPKKYSWRHLTIFPLPIMKILYYNSQDACVKFF